MTVRVLLISPAMGPAFRAARFGEAAAAQDATAPVASLDPVAPVDPVDEAGARQARAVREEFPRTDTVYVSPSPRCLRTADLLGLGPAARPTAGLAPWAMGRWQGRTLDEVAAEDPGAVTAWLTDPAAAPHGGEPLTALLARTGAWLDALDPATPGVLAVAEPDLVRAAAVHALGAPAASFWRFDVRPLTATALTGRSGRWNLQGGRPL
ncbi:histidine phosphatase family protein [Streptomyces sp. NPDC093085]|uniref:histidine phosphatase family protein n=1 Tax=Streptomyces sp. NPDC093085 TaxID=3155068 RepID=UPI00343463FB